MSGVGGIKYLPMEPNIDTLLQHLETNKLTKKDMATLRRIAIGWKQIQSAGDHSIVIGGSVNESTMVMGGINIFIQGAAGEQFLELWTSEQNRIASDPHDSLLQDYLSALRIDCDNHPYLSLYDIRPRMSLDQVYIPIRFRPKDQNLSSKQLDHQLFIADILNQKDSLNITILGGPGSGKSTLLRQIAKYAWHEPEKIGLEKAHLPLILPAHLLAQSDGSLVEAFRHVISSTDMQMNHPLPEGFFLDWAEKEETKWLLLLDGLDEVPKDKRASFITRLRNFLLGQKLISRVIITSRPSGYDSGEFDDFIFSEYEVLPFSSDQIKLFADHWFGEQAQTFLQALVKNRLGTLYDNPLLLTIAVKVFLEYVKTHEVGDLPKQRSEFYDNFVEILLEEASSRGLSKDLGGELSGNPRFLLAVLAWEMTRHPAHGSEDALSKIALEYLRDKNGMDGDRAETLGHQFIRSMSRRSGIFLRSGKAFDWLHPTIREYLAAWHLVRTEHLEAVPEAALWEHHYLFYPDYKEVTLFIINILDAKGCDVTPWIQTLHASQGGMVSGEALREARNVDFSKIQKIVDELFQKTYSCWHGDGTVQLLGDLSFFPLAKKRLMELIYEDPDKFIDAPVRDEAVKALGRHGHVQELIALAHDEILDEWMRYRAAQALEEFGYPDEAIQAWRWLAQDEDMDFSHRVDAAEGLGRLGLSEEAKALLVMRVHDTNPRSYYYMSKQPIKALSRLGHTETLLDLVQDYDLQAELRLRAAQELIDQNHVEGIVPILREMASKNDLDLEDRSWSATLLGKAGFKDEAVPLLLSVVRGGGLSEQDYWSISDTLKKWGYIVEAAYIYKMMVCNTDLDENTRKNAAAALYHREGRPEDFLELVRDDHLEVEFRATAAFGYVERVESLAAATNLINDKQLPAKVQLYAILALMHRSEGVLKNIDLYLSHLRHLAEDSHSDEDVQQEARQILISLDEESRFLIEFGRSEKEGTEKRIEAAKVLFKLGYPQEAIQILTRIAHDKDKEKSHRAEALTALEQFGSASAKAEK